MSLALDYPLLFEPVYKDYVWGGRRIPERYHRRAPPLAAYAESWEISDRAEGMSVVRNGPLAGRTLRELAREAGRRLCGSAWRGAAFPLLIKLIDARSDLSVQVHPDDESARRTGTEAKTEMWYILDADAGARIFAGLRPGTREAALREALAAGRVEGCLQQIPARPHEAVFVPGGRVHALGAGCLLLEVQQNSNTTFRLYDWGRVDRDGKPRPLHIEPSMQVIRWDDAAPLVAPPRPLRGGTSPRWEILRCPHFAVNRARLTAPERFVNDGASFRALFVAEGAARVSAGGADEDLPAGTSCLLAAEVGAYRLEPLSAGGADVLEIGLV